MSMGPGITIPRITGTEEPIMEGPSPMAITPITIRRPDGERRGTVAPTAALPLAAPWAAGDAPELPEGLAARGDPVASADLGEPEGLEDRVNREMRDRGRPRKGTFIIRRIEAERRSSRTTVPRQWGRVLGPPRRRERITSTPIPAATCTDRIQTAVGILEAMANGRKGAARAVRISNAKAK